MKFARGGIQVIDFNKSNKIDCNSKYELTEYNLVPMPLNVPINYNNQSYNNNQIKKIEKKNKETIVNKNDTFVIRKGSNLSNM